MPDVQSTIQHIVRQYRRRTFQRAGLIIGLGGASLLLWGWRLWAVESQRSWVMGIGSALGVALLAWQGWQVQRQHLTGASLALELDQRFGCAARFVTAVEFASDPNPPALYPILLEDTTRVAAQMQHRLPRVWDARTCVCALALLLALAWPHRHAPLQRLASALMMPARNAGPTLPPKSSPPQPPPSPAQSESKSSSTAQQLFPSSPQQQEGCQGGASGQQNQPQASQGGGSQSPSGQSGNSQAPQQPQNQHGSSSSSGSASNAAGSAGTQTSHGQQASPQGAAQQSGSSQSGQQQQAQSGAASSQQSGGTSSSQQASSTKSQGHSSGSQTASKSGTSGSQSAQAQQQSGTSGAQHNQSASQGAQMAQQGQASGSSPGTSGANGQQAALQQDIQQLLKQMNAELQQMQAEMSQSPPSEASTPGSGTDADLYGDATALEQAAGAQMPIQFDTDEQSGSGKNRKGSGIGKPSGKVSAALPQTAPEDVAATEQSQEEQAISRQPIPPEYQPVFEHASQAKDQQ